MIQDIIETIWEFIYDTPYANIDEMQYKYTNLSNYKTDMELVEHILNQVNIYELPLLPLHYQYLFCTFCNQKTIQDVITYIIQNPYFIQMEKQNINSFIREKRKTISYIKNIYS